MFSGQRLKEIREAQGMSQASVAKHLGISRSSYFNWENGKTKPNQKNLSVLAELFGVAETYFLSEHEIVEVYLELNEENRQEALRLTKALLEEQEAEKQKQIQEAAVTLLQNAANLAKEQTLNESQNKEQNGEI